MGERQLIFPRHLGHEVAIVVVVCTVCLFLFPAASGPYSAMHGPVTALLSHRARARVWLGMALAAFSLAGLAMPEGSEADRSALPRILPPQFFSPEEMAVLRC
jgi:hypothetical protein